jgi:hypothetical protein
VKSRRSILVALLLGLMALASASVGIGPSYASQYFAAHIQRVPQVLWTVPGPEPLDGIGQWVYVAPIPPAGPVQQPTTGYVYGLGFSSSGGRGTLGLSRDGQGGIAGIQLVPPSGGDPAPVTVRYDWSPGKFYFLLAYHLEGDAWAGWVLDNAASAWTFVGTVQAPAGSGLLAPTSVTTVGGAESQTRPAFSQVALGAASGTCRVFPQVDAYFYPPVGYRGTATAQATLTEGTYRLGDCPTQLTVEADWAHIRLGSPPFAS